MSKGNKKDKKGQPSSVLEQQFQHQKRELLDCQFSLKKMQQRINDLTEDNIRLRNQIDQSQQRYGEQVEQLSIKNMANEKRLLGLSNEKTKLQIENEQKQNKIRSLEKILAQEQQMRQKDMEEIRKNQNFELAKFESQLSEYKLYMSERDEMELERQQLREKIQIQKANKLRQVADKERQKVQATDKLKDEMQHKIDDMSKDVFSLKRQQLSTTTRLTMLQNHQLTSELQYQSKQTEKLIFKNEEYEQKIASLKQQLDIHKEVEDELAKRSHFSKGIIKKLNLRISELDNEVQNLKNLSCLPKGKSFLKQSSLKGQSQSQFKTVDNYEGNSLEVQKEVSQGNNSSGKHSTINKSNDVSSMKKLISSLELELERSQKQYVELLTHYESIKSERHTLYQKVQLSENKANSLYKIMQRYYDQVIVKNQLTLLETPKGSDFLKETQPFELDLKTLRDMPVEDWRLEDLTLIMQMLLNILQPHMARGNFMIPAVRKNIMLSEGILSSRRIDLMASKSLPKISTQRRDGNSSNTSKLQQVPANVASKIVGSNLREWGQTVRLNKMCLKRKYKLAQSFRG